MSGAGESRPRYFRQLLCGRDVAAGDPIARQMVNFTYLIGDRTTGEALVVDPAYAPADLLDIAAGDGMTIVGALASHYHADHIGGSMFNHGIAGIAELLEVVDVPIHVQHAEAEFVATSTGVSSDSLVLHDGGDVVTVGDLAITCIHTPGHTPGSQCFLAEGRLVSGDTLFLEGCGRTDLPGSDPEAMYDSLVNRLGRVPDDTVLYPGHFYAEEPSAELGEIRRTNYVFAPRSAKDWLALFGR